MEETMDIDKKVSEMMFTVQKDLPPKALDYVAALSKKVGTCGETFVTAFYDYCQLELNMKTDDETYDVHEDDVRISWYKEAGLV